MTAQKLDGTATAAAIKAELTARVAALRERGIVPGLGTVLVGDDPGSRWYVNGKHKDCAEVGIESIRVDLPATATQEEIEAAVAELNADPACTGYIVQLPLPKGRDENRVLGLIDPAKDADGLHPTNLGWLVLGNEAPLPCTPAGIVELLRRHDVAIAGAEVVVVGRGVTVGRPLGLLLTRRSENATVTLCHTGTVDLAAHVRRADIVVAAAGVPGIITGDMVKPGAAVLDVGVTRVDGKLAGDVAPEVWEVAGWVSPNPGGVGPMTRAMLLSNIVAMAEKHGVSESEPPVEEPGPEEPEPSAATRPRSAARSTSAVLIATAVGIGDRLPVARLAARRASGRRRAARRRRCSGWCSRSATRACSPYATGWSTWGCSVVVGGALFFLAGNIPDQPGL